MSTRLTLVELLDEKAADTRNLPMGKRFYG